MKAVEFLGLQKYLYSLRRIYNQMISLGMGRVQEQEESGRRELTTKPAVSSQHPGEKREITTG